MRFLLDADTHIRATVGGFLCKWVNFSAILKGRAAHLGIFSG